MCTAPKQQRTEVEDKALVHQVRMLEEIPDDLNNITADMLNDTFKALSMKNEKYELIMKGGPALKAALFSVCQSVLTTEKFPENWRETTLIQLYKGKGPRNNLENLRHIHIKNEFSKFFGHLVVTAVKPHLYRNLSKFQIATKPGHRPQEHLFVLKSIIALNPSLGNSIILQTYDYSKFFDRESLSDCMNSLYRYDVKGKLYRLLYLMNRSTRFRVQTPVGMTEEATRGEGLAQGSLEGALVSSVSLDFDVNESFQDSVDEARYFHVRLQPLLYHDDVARIGTTVKSAQVGNSKMEVIAETKLLDYNLEKSGFLIIGETKAKKKMQIELEESSLLFCDKNMKQENATRYLDDWLSTDGLADSVKVTVNKRFGLAQRAIADIRAIIDYCRNYI